MIRSSLLTVLFILAGLNTYGQRIYHNTSGELIFSQSQLAFSESFMQQYPNAEMAKNNVRFTCFLHLGEYWHYDLNNAFGFITGIGIRNIGMSSDENLPNTVTTTNQNVEYTHYKIVKRLYTLGVPLALKIGSFKDHLFFFAGGEYEFALQYKEKFWKGSWDRSGQKTKSSTWFGDQTPTFIPSVFGGIQMPGGINVKFKYYLTDFLNRHFDRLVRQGLGLDRHPELLPVFFRHYRRLVYLSQAPTAELTAQAKAHADFLGLEYVEHNTGLAPLDLVLKEQAVTWQS